MKGTRSDLFFPPEEYQARWARVHQAMAARGYEHLLIWQRGAGTFDRVGDVWWLTNFVMNGSGQDPASEESGAPYTFCAVLIRRGREPELHVGLPAEDLDLSRVVCGEVIAHAENLMTGLAAYLSAQGIEGQIAVVGDDVLPGMYDRLLRRHTPQIKWHADETLLLGPQSMKSARELEAYRTAGDMVTRALTAACESLLTGHSSAEAAAVAAAILMRAGGGFHRIDIHHGADTEHHVISMDLYGYHTDAPGGRRHGARLDHGTHFPRLLDGPWSLVDLWQSADPIATRIAGRRRRGRGRRGGRHAPGDHAAAVGRSRRGDCPQARLLRPSAIEGSTAGAWPQHELHPLRNSHRRSRRGYRRSTALRCAARSRHGDGVGDLFDAPRRGDRRFRTKSHRHNRRAGAAHSHTDALRVTSPPPQGPRFDSLGRLAYVNALFIIGTLGTLITPAMLDGWAQLKWSATRLGAVAAIELAGLALGSLSGLYWQRRWRWRQVALPSILVGNRGQCRLRDREGFRRRLRIALPGRPVGRTSISPVFSSIG